MCVKIDFKEKTKKTFTKLGKREREGERRKKKEKGREVGKGRERERRKRKERERGEVSKRRSHSNQEWLPQHLQPTLVSVLREKKIVFAAAGVSHSIFLDTAGNAYTCGKGQGLLGVGDTQIRTVPTWVQSLQVSQ